MLLFTGTDIKCLDNDANNISRDQISQVDVASLLFNLAPHSETGEHLNLQKTGTLHLAAQFSKAVSKRTQVLIFGEFHSVIEIDRYQVVFSDLD